MSIARQQNPKEKSKNCEKKASLAPMFIFLVSPLGVKSLKILEKALSRDFHFVARCSLHATGWSNFCACHANLRLALSSPPLGLRSWGRAISFACFPALGLTLVKAQSGKPKIEGVKFYGT